MMLNFNNDAIAIDLTEITAELDIPFNKYKPVKPVKYGCRMDNFILLKENLNKQPISRSGVINNTTLFRQFGGKPLVISFYSSYWKEHGQNHLIKLNNLHREIKSVNANLLIITSDEADNTLDEVIWNNSLSLNFYLDDDNNIAKQFNVYSDADPVWNRYAGIDENVPLLATFVLDHTNQVVFDHVNYSLEDHPSPAEILNAIANNVNVLNKKSA